MTLSKQPKKDESRFKEGPINPVSITNEKLELEIQAERDKLTLILESMEDGVYIVNKDCDIEFVNTVLKKEFGSPEGKKCHEYFHDSDKPCTFCKNKDVFSGKTVQWEWTSPKNGRTYNLIDTPLKNADGTISKLEIFRDITERKRAEEALLQSEKNYRDLFNNATDAIYIQDREGRFIDVNQGAVEMYGYPKEFFIGKTPEFLSAPGKNDMEQIVKFVEDAFNGKPRQYDFWGIRKNGEIFPKMVRSLKGSYMGKEVVVTHALDITERQQAEKALQESEEKFRMISDRSVAGIYIIQGEKIKYANLSMLRIFGYEEEEVINKMDPKDLIHPDDHKVLIRNMRERFAGKELEESYVLKGVKKDGAIIYIEISGGLIDFSGRPALSGTLFDVTGRKAADEEIRRLSTAMEHIPAAVGITDLKGDLVYVNLRFTQMTGYPAEELIGNNPRVLKSGETSDEEYHSLWKTIKEKGTWKGEFHNKHKDGSLYWESAQISPIFEEKGDITNYIKVAEDITKRKKIEEALRVSEEKFSKAFHSNPAIAGLSDVETGEYVEVNQSFCDILGFTHEEVIGKVPTDLLHLDMKWEKDTLAKLKERGVIRDAEAEIRAKNGTIVTVLISAEIVEINNRKYNFTTAIDITKRKQAEEALRESEQLYRTLIKTTSEGYWRIGSDLITIDVNDSLCDMLGYSRSEMIGRHVFDFFDGDNLKLITKQTSKISSTRHRSYDNTLKRKNGDNLQVHFSATTLPKKDGVKPGSFAFITDMTERKGLTEKLLQANRELKDSERATLNILEDLSFENRVRKIAEEEKEVEMNRAEFYLDLMSHDITNIHQGIYSWIQLAMYAGKDKNSVELDLKVGENLVNRSIALVKNVQLLSGLKKMDIIFHPFELGASIEKTIRGVEDIFVNKDVVINYELPAEEILIQAEPLIEQLFLNLIHNGVKFQYGDKAVIDIDLSASEKERLVRFEISDHGPGIPDEMKKNLFDRFKKKDMKFHAGIGLSLVKELVDRYNGTIEVKDRIEGDHKKGAKFVVTFPLGDGAPDSTIKA